MFNFRFFI